MAADYNSDTDNNSSTSHLKNAIATVRSTSPGDSLVPKTKKKNTFASIITGGRSPQSALADGATLTDNVDENTEQTPVHRNNDESAATVVKTQKRKRRIEFITKAPEQSTNDVNVAVAEDVKNVAVVEVPPPNSRGLYNNFTRSHVEFVNQKESKEDPPTKAATTTSEQSAVAVNNRSELANDLRDTIEAKLKFLCEGRTDVSAVQAILIQLEVIVKKICLFTG